MPKITLKAARVNAGLKQKDVAQKLGVADSTISSWERGRSFPDAKQIKKLEEIYGVSYDAINF